MNRLQFLKATTAGVFGLTIPKKLNSYVESITDVQYAEGDKVIIGLCTLLVCSPEDIIYDGKQSHLNNNSTFKVEIRQPTFRRGQITDGEWSWEWGVDKWNLFGNNWIPQLGTAKEPRYECHKELDYFKLTGTYEFTRVMVPVTIYENHHPEIRVMFEVNEGDPFDLDGGSNTYFKETPMIVTELVTAAVFFDVGKKSKMVPKV